MSDQWDHLELTPEQVDGLPAHLWGKCDDCGRSLAEHGAHLRVRGEFAVVVLCDWCAMPLDE
jgi:hypothetical protein